jgi:DNA-binding NtrC family response regulator
MPETRTPVAGPGPSTGGSPELVGSSAPVSRLRELVRRTAARDGGVLLVAERGVDLESVARELHERGHQAAGPFVAFAGHSAAAGLERQLFGDPSAETPHDLEAVTASSPIAAARGGTLFLSDVAELPAAVQARLARIARDGEVRVDGERSATSLRLVAGASPDIDADVRAHRVRDDLFRRLSLARIDVPPLRDRVDDVPEIAARLLDDLSSAREQPRRTFARAAQTLLAALTWPGNLTELRDVVERTASGTTAGLIQVDHVLPALRLERAPAVAPTGSLRDARLRFEREYIAAVLHHHGWRIADAAQTLGIQRPNLYRKARQLGLSLTIVAD